VRKDHFERVICVVPACAHLVSAYEVHEHVLVHERQAKAVCCDGTGHRLHDARRRGAL
jgi:hypothetical protein